MGVVRFCAVVGLLCLLANARTFKQDGSFKIVQLTDLHLGETEAKDEQSLQAVKALLQAEADCDLVVLSGDMVSGFAQKHSLWVWDQTYVRLLAILEAAGTQHAIVLGNHDDEGMLSRREVVRRDQRAKLSLTQAGPENITGVTNYFLDISSAHNGTGVAARLWFLDSMDTECEGVAGWGCVAEDTVDWIEQQSAGLASTPVALAFVHIPVPEFMGAWNRGQSVGHKGEAVCCPSFNSGLVQAFKRMGVGAIYSGHDHNNDFVANLGGMRFAYGRKTGYGSYGPPEGFLHGARVIILRENEHPARSETYLRLENGERFDQTRSRDWALQVTCMQLDNLFSLRYWRMRSSHRRRSRRDISHAHEPAA